MIILNLNHLKIFILPLEWVESEGEIPEGAVKGGKDYNDVPLYVARAWHEGHLIPGKTVKKVLKENYRFIVLGKLNPNWGACHIACDGKELSVHSFEILVGQGSWVSSASFAPIIGSSQFPLNAVVGNFVNLN